MPHKIHTEDMEYKTWVEITGSVDNDDLLADLLSLNFTELLDLEVFYNSDDLYLSEYVNKYFDDQQSTILKRYIEKGIGRLNKKVNDFFNY